jgi:hypothetical protein
MNMFDVRHRTISGLAVCFAVGLGGMTLAQHTGKVR